MNLTQIIDHRMFKNANVKFKIITHRFVIIALIIGCLFIQNTFAQKQPDQIPGLAVGDDAPELKIEKWLKGGGFSRLEKGKIYLVDIWATWCAPCLAGMPKLNQLQQKYKDKGLEIIGITSEDPYGNSLDEVVKFIQKKDAAINYHLAWVPPSPGKDTQGIFLHPWMRQAGTMNMPQAFIVDKNGKIAFIGDPFTIDKPLENIVNDRHDLTVLRAGYLESLAAEQVMKKFVSALEANDTNQAVIYGNQILTEFKQVKPNTYLTIGVRVSAVKEKTDERLLEIAMKAIRQGIIATQFESSGFFDVLASLYAVKGDYFQAANAEKVAISLSEGAMRDNQIKNLEKYLALLSK